MKPALGDWTRSGHSNKHVSEKNKRALQTDKAVGVFILLTGRGGFHVRTSPSG